MYPSWLQRWVSVCGKAIYSWLDDRAPTMGAAIAYYTVFSIAPILVMVIAIAGLVFGQKAAEGALFGELTDLVGPESASAVQAMLRSASGSRSGVFATVVGICTLIIGATAVLTELQAALNLIWKAPPSEGLGVWHILRSRLVSLSLILVTGSCCWCRL
jgi:membrane protein